MPLNTINNAPKTDCILGKELNIYFKVAQAGLWGAIAFIFSIIISYTLQKYLIPLFDIFF